MLKDKKIKKELLSLTIQRWATYDDTHGYASEKIARAGKLWERGNLLSMFNMFDFSNKSIIFIQASKKLQKFLVALDSGLLK